MSKTRLLTVEQLSTGEPFLFPSLLPSLLQLSSAYTPYQFIFLPPFQLPYCPNRTAVTSLDLRDPPVPPVIKANPGFNT